jgi:tRNA G37 N-methylase Trm5
MKNADIQTSGGYNYPQQPRQQVIDLQQLLPEKSHILDIGAGFGNNTLPLLNLGHSVTVTETNPDCIKYLNTLKNEYGDRIKVLNEPIQELNNSVVYDAIICTMVLHFLQPAEADHAIKNIKNITSDGGFNVITNYLYNHKLLPKYTWMLQNNQLSDYYEDWQVISYDESYPYGLKQAHTLRQLARLCLGRRGYKSARLIAKK